MKKIRILVIVDSTLKEEDRFIKGRQSFWGSTIYNSSLRDKIEICELSLPEEHEKRAYIEFSPAMWDVVIFNWDVLDADATFNSDATQQIVSYHYRTSLKEYVENGGILLIEAQTSYWSLDQKAYNAILGEKEIHCTKADRFAPWGKSIYINEIYTDHPLLRGLSKQFHSNCNNICHEPWFPPGSVDLRVIDCTYPEKIYTGSFEKWSNKWLPLLLNEKKEAVLLIAPFGSGLIIATTMFIASANNSHILNSLLIRSPALRHETREYHERLKLWRWVNAIAVTAILSLIFFVMLTILSNYWPLLKKWPLLPKIFGSFIGGLLARLAYATTPKKSIKLWIKRLLNR